MRNSWEIVSMLDTNIELESNKSTKERQCHKVLPLTQGLQELKILKVINGIGGVPGLRDYKMIGQDLHLYTTYFEGQSLDQYEITEHNALTIWMRALCILDQVHQRGVLHRDLCPRHIVISQTGEVAILDFGRATLYEDFEEVVGTLEYAPPEALFMPQKFDETSDRFALAKCFYPKFVQIFSKKKPEVLSVFKGAMALNPEKRYQSANQLINALTRYL